MSSPAPREASPRPIRAKRDLWVLLVLMGLFVVGFVGLAATVGWDDILSQLRTLALPQLAILLGLSLVNYALRAIRWHIFVHRLGLALPLGQSMLHYIAGFAMTITPGRIGELWRLRWIFRLTGRPFERLLPLPLVDRAYDVAAVGIVLAGCAVLAQTGIVGAIPAALIAIVFAFLVTHPPLVYWLVNGLWRMIGRWPRRFASLRQAARSMRVFGTWGVVLPAMTLSILGWVAEGYALYLLLVWMGAEISFIAATVIFLFSNLAGGATGAPGGVGGAEAAMLVLLTAQGVPLETAIPAIAVIRVTTLWFAILLGLAAFPFAEKHSRRA